MVEPGTVFAGYIVHRRIGAGGMGTVYLARHPRLPIDVALKVLDPALGRTPQDRARFEREADIAARMRHPHIVPVHDRGAEGDYLWIAMDYVDGCDAAQLLERGPLPPAVAIDIVAQAADALDHAHTHRVLHRDIKPANLLIATVNHRKHVYLSDFGISRLMDDTASATAVRASFAYAAPELLTGDPVDERADLYSLGATLYHLLTGRVPFPRRSLAAVMHAHLNETPPPLADHRPDLPATLDEVLHRALSKAPGERFPSGRALAVAARKALHNNASHTGHRSTEPAGRPRDGRTDGGETPDESRSRHDAASPADTEPSGRDSAGRGAFTGESGAAAGTLDDAGRVQGPVADDESWAAALLDAPFPGRFGAANPRVSDTAGARDGDSSGQGPANSARSEDGPPLAPPTDRPPAVEAERTEIIWRGSISGGPDYPPGAPADRPSPSAMRPHPAPRRRARNRAMLAGSVAGILVVAALLVPYLMTHGKYYVGQQSGRVVLFQGSPSALLGFSLHEIEQAVCVTRAGDVHLADPGAGFPAGCRELLVTDLVSTAQVQVARGLPTGSRDEALVQLQVLTRQHLLPPCAVAATQPSDAPPSTTTAPPTVTAPPLGPASTAGQSCRVSE
ncbi:protein kinase [Nocardia sp. 2]|uniref:non-specific serine/threonine protein kinase n=1 Tax=Nocardia acididurans TaxID=2802282 RepID=A0ABS1M041_9NOCA|nr:serine/threonine-protein kinase [Nocardia acididurans]MBL1074032.1 protein kinase [Nocardia acididurans]